MVAMLALAAAALAATPEAQAGTLPPGFHENIVYSELTEPTSVVFSPDERVFVAEKSGIIKVYDRLSDKTPEIFADLTEKTDDFWDRGLLGMALDPKFPAEPYVYVLYTLDAKPGGAAPQWGGTSPSDSCPTPPGATAEGCVVTGRLAKLTVSGNKVVAETPLITDWCQQYPSHSIGDLAFGADGSLYVSGGDGASFTFIDWGQEGNPCNDPPLGIGQELTPPSAEGGSLRAQDVRTPADPTDLNGSILRVDPKTGEGRLDNPFAGSLDANACRIVAYGLRNPFRFTVRPGTNEVWIGDVGFGTWEEIDRLSNPAAIGATNFGWPCYEGDNEGSARQPQFDATNLTLCESLYEEGPSAVEAPYYAYKHTEHVVPGETCTTGSSSISGMAFYESGGFPAGFDGGLVFADYSRNCIWTMMPGKNGLPDPKDIIALDQGAHAPVDLTIGPQGDVYYVDLTGGKIWRISHPAGDQPPTAVAAATPQNGAAPLNVELSAAGSSDPDPGDTLSYSWDLDGDGVFGDSTAASLSHIYTQPGVHIATVRVTDTSGESDTDSVSIQVDNTPPTATITSPLPSFTWAVGDPIEYSATATDPQQGTLPASAYKWSIIIHHCPSNCHTHQVENIDGQTGGTFLGVDHEYPSWLEFKLTVTDAGGLTDTESVEVHPKTVSLQIQSLPISGFEVSIGGVTGITPFTETVIQGSNNSVAAPAQILEGAQYEFGAWSDGGAASHNLIANQDKTITAVFGPPAAPAITGTTPASGGNDNSPRIAGTVGADFPTAVKIFRSADCSGAVAAEGSVSEFTGAGVTTSVPANETTQISAATSNAAGRSGCSNSLSYTTDSTPPAVPTIASTTPKSPANDNTPTVSGAAEAGSTVKIYESAACAGPVAASGTAEQFETGLEVAVADDSQTSMTATATDSAANTSECSAAFSYTEDSTAPSAPQILNSAPESPANTNNPSVSGEADAGSTVSLFFGSSCSGPAAASGTAAEFASGLTISVADNSDNSFTADAVDSAGNTSACSSVFKYVEDSTAPTAPTLTGVSPASPANDNGPVIRGAAEAGSTVRVYLKADCSGPPVATVPAAQLGSGVQVSIADDTTTILTATATDAAANESSCSSAIVYTEDSTAPETTITKAPTKRQLTLTATRAGRRPSFVKAEIAFRANEPSARFLCRMDAKPPAPCSSPLRGIKLKPGSHKFTVQAIDEAGNADATPAARRLVVTRGSDKGRRRRPSLQSLRVGLNLARNW